MPMLSAKLSQAAIEQVRRDAQAHGVSVSEWVRHKLGVDTGGLVAEDSQHFDFEDHERRISRLEEMAGL